MKTKKVIAHLLVMAVFVSLLSGLAPLTSEASPAGSWINDKGIWYFRLTNGRNLTGWLEIRGVWYYLHPNTYPVGKMATGRQYLPYENRYDWYYFDASSGAMVRGWHLYGGNWYYYRTGANTPAGPSNGPGGSRLERGTWRIDGLLYDFDNGICKNPWNPRR